MGWMSLFLILLVLHLIPNADLARIRKEPLLQPLLSVSWLWRLHRLLQMWLVISSFRVHHCRLKHQWVIFIESQPWLKLVNTQELRSTIARLIESTAKRAPIQLRYTTILAWCTTDALCIDDLVFDKIFSCLNSIVVEAWVFISRQELIIASHQLSLIAVAVWICSPHPLLILDAFDQCAQCSLCWVVLEFFLWDVWFFNSYKLRIVDTNSRLIANLRIQGIKWLEFLRR